MLSFTSKFFLYKINDLFHDISYIFTNKRRNIRQAFPWMQGELTSTEVGRVEKDKNQNIYNELGGQEGIAKAVKVFYTKVLRESSLAPFFEGVNMAQQESMMTAFLSSVSGWPKVYTGCDLRAAHARLVDRGLNASHFELVLSALSQTLDELGVKVGIRNVLVEHILMLKQEVLGIELG